MKAQDFMIGDIVAVNNTPLRIAALGTAKAGFIDAKGEMFYCYYDNIEPVPLDSEIMKNFGFVCSYDDYHQWYIEINHNNLWLEQSRIEPHTYFMRLFNGLKVRYVHELQHALKLCGIDKNIEL